MKLNVDSLNYAKQDIEALYQYLSSKGYTSGQALKLLEQTKDAIERSCREEVKNILL